MKSAIASPQQIHFGKFRIYLGGVARRGVASVSTSAFSSNIECGREEERRRRMLRKNYNLNPADRITEVYVIKIPNTTRTSILQLLYGNGVAQRGGT